ncbi:PAS domain-containing protein [Halococcoides cellulosivorans]|uniref:PAS domain-containing protein n=1 Tax=Halococcoides cellulosivorans TaxID=1679096 RepID=UPI00131EDD19|nr:PAS domain-containing protein [Halococcoides cellulosivorans]
MTVPALDDALVGVVPGPLDAVDGYRSVCESLVADTVTVEPSAASFRTTEADLLIVQGDDGLDAIEAADSHPPTMFVGRDPVAATRAMGAGADVFLSTDRSEDFGDRLRSLYRGAAVDARSAGEGALGSGSVEARAYATLMGDFDDHIYVFDRHGRFVRVNETKAAFHDTTPVALEGKSEFDVFFPETAAEIYADNMAVLEGRREVCNETEWVENAAGEYVHVSVSKHPIHDADGHIIGLIGISHDVTEITRRRTLVDDVARVVEHLYGIYDHNFRNLVQTRIGIQASLRDATDAEASGREHLDGLREAVAAEDDAAEQIEAAIEDWERLSDALQSAGAAERELIDTLETLVGDFGDLVSVVRTDGEIRQFDVVEMADQSQQWTVIGPTVSVRTDDSFARLFFDQLTRVVPTGATVTIEPTRDGFELDVPAHVVVPEIAARYRDQDLLSGSRPLLKASVLAEVMGWNVETRHPAPDRTVLVVDTAAWKRRAGAT